MPCSGVVCDCFGENPRVRVGWEWVCCEFGLECCIYSSSRVGTVWEILGRGRERGVCVLSRRLEGLLRDC